MKSGVLKNLAKFTGKHLYQSLLFNKAVDLRAATLLKKRLWHRCFLADFVKVLRIYFLQNKHFRTTASLRIFWKHELNIRSSHWSCSVKKGVLKNFANFTEKHLCWSFQLYQKVSPTQVFSCGICEIFKRTYFGEHLRTTASETCSNYTHQDCPFFFCPLTLLAQIGAYALAFVS